MCLVACLQGREKIHLIHFFTELGFDALISDVDTVWLRNPLPYMKQVHDAWGYECVGAEPARREGLVNT